MAGAAIAGPRAQARALPSEAGEAASITAALAASAAAWSKGDLHGFMRVYENSPATTYVTAAGLVTGYGAIEAMYAARFGAATAQAGPAALGQLSLTVLACRKLGPAYALVTGRFLLRHPATHKPDSTGIFTLVFHQSADGWGIISDHTS
jgi:ketosteroid isomerase-like protein